MAYGVDETIEREVREALVEAGHDELKALQCSSEHGDGERPGALPRLDCRCEWLEV
jgi:hypothetical protein